MPQLEEEGGVPMEFGWSHLTSANQDRLTTVLRVHIPEVFTNNRSIEEQTGYSSEIGKNMMVDVLAHLSTLALRTDLDATGQASQIAKIEEHLCRAIVEHPEEVVRNRTGEITERWREYQREVVPLREEGALRGMPRQQELDELRARIKSLLESARRQKPDQNDWEQSLNAAAAATEAAHLSAELADKLEQCIGAANNLKTEREREAKGEQAASARDARNRRQWAIGLVVMFAVATASFVAGRLFEESDEPVSPAAKPAGRASP